MLLDRGADVNEVTKVRSGYNIMFSSLVVIYVHPANKEGGGGGGGGGGGLNPCQKNQNIFYLYMYISRAC